MDLCISPAPDEPTDCAEMLGHGRLVSSLESFLEDDRMAPHMCIAIDGEWGSGKTSIAKTLARRISQKSHDVVFFEAWKYEHSNPVMGLVSELTSKYYGSRRNAKKAARAAAYFVSSRLNIDSEKIIDMVSEPKPVVKKLSCMLNDIVVNKTQNQRLVIIIDDLDRCDPDSSLQVFALIKMLLGTKGCVCIAAVDLVRLKQAWGNKYQQDPSSTGSAGNYLDKIFQVCVSIPKPTVKGAKKYLESMTGDMGDDIADLFLEVVPKNPRSIKRALNMASYRSHLLTHGKRTYSALLWTLFEEAATDVIVPRICSILESNGSSLGKMIINKDGKVQLTNAVMKIIDEELDAMHASDCKHKIKKFLEIGHGIATILLIDSFLS